MRAVLKNLTDQILTDDNTIMRCSECGAEYSAHKGDYDWYIVDPDYEFKCCDLTMDLVTKKVTYCH